MGLFSKDDKTPVEKPAPTPDAAPAVKAEDAPMPAPTTPQKSFRDRSPAPVMTPIKYDAKAYEARAELRREKYSHLRRPLQTWEKPQRFRR